MKKKRLDDYTSSLCWRKKFLVMRLAYILMVGLVVLVPTSVSAQGKMVSLDIRSETAKWRVDEDQRSDRGKHPL